MIDLFIPASRLMPPRYPIIRSWSTSPAYNGKNILTLPEIRFSGFFRFLVVNGVVSKDEGLSRADASTVIMKELWKKLRETHKLRVVK